MDNFPNLQEQLPKNLNLLAEICNKQNPDAPFQELGKQFVNMKIDLLKNKLLSQDNNGNITLKDLCIADNYAIQ